MDELTPAELQERERRLDAIFERVGGLQLLSDMAEAVGSNVRVAELIGWAVWWGLTGQSDITDLRKRLQVAGQGRSTAFRALADYRRIGSHLLQKYGEGVGVDDAPRLMQKLAAHNRPI